MNEIRHNILSNGAEEWRLNGEFHREGGPASIRLDGSKHWCIHGKYHRIDGPAATWPGGKIVWWLNGLPYLVFDDWLLVTPISKEQKIELKLLYG